MKKIITRVEINESAMSSTSQSRLLKVYGDVGAEFMLNIIKINGVGKESYYSFKSNSFTETFNSENSHSNILTLSTFSININFPADATGDVYSIKTIAKEQTTMFSTGHYVNVKTISQVGQTSLFLQIPSDPAMVDAAHFTSLPNPVQSTGSTALSSVVGFPVDWALTNTSSDAKGFGLRLPNNADEFLIPDSYWYSQGGASVVGSHSAQTVINLNGTSFIFPGMLFYNFLVNGAYPVVVSKTSTTVTLNVAIDASNGLAVYFRAYGPSKIKKAFGMEADFSGFVAKGIELTKTVRTSTVFPTSTGNVDLNLNGTYGIGGGGHVRIRGLNISEVGNNNLITLVEPSSTAGHIRMAYAGGAETVTKTQTIPVGTKIYVEGSFQQIKITGNVKIKKYPETNAKIILDVPQFITAGLADE